jgi:hypothetical protein
MVASGFAKGELSEEKQRERERKRASAIQADTYGNEQFPQPKINNACIDVAAKGAGSGSGGG